MILPFLRTVVVKDSLINSLWKTPLKRRSIKSDATGFLLNDMRRLAYGVMCNISYVFFNACSCSLPRSHKKLTNKDSSRAKTVSAIVDKSQFMDELQNTQYTKKM